MGRNIRKELSIKYSQKLLDHAKQSATDALKTSSKRVIQEIAEATVDLSGNKIANNIKKDSQKPYHKIIQKQIKKHLGKNLYRQN